jgi:hypothetical protein
MKALKNLYKEFFGLNEQDQSKKFDHTQLSAYNKELEKTAQLINSMTEADLDEAQLVNHITDYRGGVEYVLRDPSQAKDVAAQIQEWTTKKGFTVVKHTISKTGKVGYFYFRLGEDPEREAQRIQGYFSSKLEIKFFRFRVKEEQAKPKMQQPEI